MFLSIANVFIRYRECGSRAALLESITYTLNVSQFFNDDTIILQLFDLKYNKFISTKCYP